MNKQKMTRQQFVRGMGGMTVLLMSGCGGGDSNSGSGGISLPSGSGCQASNILGNHGHALSIPTATLDATTNQVITSGGSSDHVHTVTLTPAQLADLKANKSVTVTSSSGGSVAFPAHTHSVVLQCF